MEENHMLFEKKKRKKRSKKRTEERKLDEVWRQKVKERDNYHCQVCGNQLEGKNCHAHHIIPRTMKGYRWDVNNGITLCYHHHKVGNCSPHMNAIWFTFWLKTFKYPQFKYVTSKLKEIENKNVSTG